MNLSWYLLWCMRFFGFWLILSSIALAHSLSLAQPKLASPHEEIIAQFSQDIKHSSLKIALMMPKKIIGRYSSTSIDTVMSYLSSRDVDFELRVFDCGDESSEGIASTYARIEKEEFQFIIAILTGKGAIEASKLQLKIPLYIPTVHSSQIDFHPKTNPLLFFGGISYQDQIKLLLRLHKGSHILAYNDDSPVGERLSQTLRNFLPNIQELTISNELAAAFNKEAASQEAMIDSADIFLNTPIVKTGLLLSQIGYFKKKAATFLSTQINYNPSIIILTQKRDRANLYIASSIGAANQKLIEYASLLNSDLKYDWVNYSTALGVELFFRTLFPENLPFFSETLQDNQIRYQTQIYSIDEKGFYIPIDLSAYPPFDPSSIPSQEPTKDLQESPEDQGE